MKNLKVVSIVISFLFAIILLLQWNVVHSEYIPNKNQLDSNTKVEYFLEENLIKANTHDNHLLKKSSIGMFVESLNFSTANDVEISGHIWQKINHSDKNDITPGIVFVDATGNVLLEKRYTEVYDEYNLYGWYFEANIRQAFEYQDYPIDHKTIWIKIKPIGFNLKQILIPDLNSYKKTGVEDSFGISSDIVLLGWELKESFFDYMITEYDTNFGVKSMENHLKLPILAFNIVLNRNLVNAFIINITLLFSTMILLYIIVLMITSDNSHKEAFGMDVGTAVGTSGGLFFAVLLAHIHLREQFGSVGFVYIEFFYILNYVYITATSFIFFSFYKNNSSQQPMIFNNDAYMIKLLYWPIYFAISNVYTFLHFNY